MLKCTFWCISLQDNSQNSLHIQVVPHIHLKIEQLYWPMLDAYYWHYCWLALARQHTILVILCALGIQTCQPPRVKKLEVGQKKSGDWVKNREILQKRYVTYHCYTVELKTGSYLMLLTCKCCSDSRGSKPAILANACKILSRLGKQVGKAKPASLVPRPRPNGSKYGKCSVRFTFFKWNKPLRVKFHNKYQLRFIQKNREISGLRESPGETRRVGRSGYPVLCMWFGAKFWMS